MTSNSTCARAVFCLYLLAPNLPGLLQAAEILVPEDHSTIQAGINAASSGDVVSVAPGTYPLAIPLNFTGKAIAVVGRNGPSETILRATGSNSLALLVGVTGPAGRLEGFTLRDGTPEIVQRGGCLSIEGGNPTIRNNRFENCSTIEGDARSSGGAIKVISNAAPIISGNTFVGNRSFSQGGAVHILEAGGTVQANIFENNRVSGQSESGGGGLKITFSTGKPVVVADNVFRNNIASFAGSAISVFGGDAHIIDNEITSNGPSRFGGGIHLETQSDSGGNREFIVRGNLFENNSVTDTSVAGLNFDAVSGGAMHINPGPQGETTDSTVEIRDNVFVGNSALDSRCIDGGDDFCGNGGAIEFLNALLQPQTVAGNIFEGNVADRYAAANFNSVQLQFTDNLVIGNLARHIHPGIGCVTGSAANTSTCLIARNRFIDNRYTNGGGGDGRQNDAGAINIRRHSASIVNNLFAENLGHFASIFVRSEDVDGAFSTIDHNTFFQNETTSTFFGTVALRGDGEIRNNIFSGDLRALRLDSTTSSTSQISQNNITGTSSGVARIETEVLADVDALNATAFGTDNIALDPRFEDPVNRNFVLREDSPLIDQATCIPGIDEDIRRFPRPNGPACDTGAYEIGDDLVFEDGFE